MKMLCQECGKENDVTAKFCAHCGTATREPQKAETSSKAETKEESNSVLQSLGSLVGLVIVGYVLWSVWGYAFFQSVPQLEFSKGFPANLVSITDCEWNNGMQLFCIVTHNGEAGEIPEYSLGATGYNENGIKIRDTTFPSVRIGPGQSAKAQVMMDVGDGISKILIRH